MMLRQVLICSLVVAASADAPLLVSQEPSIFPSGGTFEGEVANGITITPNGEPGQTKLYYTISTCNPAIVSGCSGWRKPTPEEAGVGEHTRELKADEKVNLSKPGLWFVSAVALTKGFAISFVENATFKISTPDIEAPKFLTLEGKYRNKVVVELKSDLVIHYTIDGTNPDINSPKYDQPFEITSPGRHVVKAVSVQGDKISPMRQATFVVSLPVAFEVSTECEECKGPTVNKPFTIMFQGFRSTADTRVFVSSGIESCDIATRGGGVTHTLQGCGCAPSPSNPTGGIVPKDLVWVINTNDSPHPEVVVCYSNDKGATWEAIPRASSPLDDQKYSFPLLAPVGGDKPKTPTQNKVEAFDAPFDWASHYQQIQNAPPSSAKLKERLAQDGQVKGVAMIGGLLLIVVILFFSYHWIIKPRSARAGVVPLAEV